MTARRVRAFVVTLLAACLCAIGGTTTAFAQDGGRTNWTVYSTFIGAMGEDIPLRIGRHDTPGRDGVGFLHIIDGHGELPDVYEIEALLAHSDRLCQFYAVDDKWRCSQMAGDRALFVVFTERVDDASGDGRPVGIITAYYSPRGCPC